MYVTQNLPALCCAYGSHVHERSSSTYKYKKLLREHLIVSCTEHSGTACFFEMKIRYDRNSVPIVSYFAS